VATLAQYRDRVKEIVKDTAGRFTDAEKENFVLEAVRQYSRDRPLVRDDLITGDGTAKEFIVPGAWSLHFSTLLGLEFPIDQVPIALLDLDDDIEVVQKSQLERIQLTRLTLQLAEQARIFYTTAHTVSAIADTVPPNDFDAVCNLAGSHLATALGAFYAESTDPTIAEDIVSHGLKQTLFDAVSASLLEKYKNHVEAGQAATGEMLHGELDVSFSWGEDLIFHPRRFR